MGDVLGNDVVAGILGSLGSGLKVFAVSLVGFAVIALGLFLFSRNSAGRLSLVSAGRFVFPPEIYRHPHTRVDLIVCIANKLIWSPLLATLAALLAAGTVMQAGLTEIFGERSQLIHNNGLILGLQFTVFYLANELSFYLAHLLMHKNKVLWSLHRPHHSAEVLTFLTGDRDHPLELLLFITSAVVIGGGCTAVLLYATGTSLHPIMPLAILASGVAAEVMDKFNHSHIRISFGPLNYVFQSSAMHQIHHSAETVHIDKNFGGTSSVFDLLFGTIYIPKADEKYRLGLGEDEIGDANPHKSVRDLYVEPIVYAWRAMREKRPPIETDAIARTQAD